MSELELDVHPSRDGVIVVSHDPDALRSAGVARALAGLAEREVRRLVMSPAARLLARGADGIITDDTRALATVFARSPRTAAWRARHAQRASG